MYTAEGTLVAWLRPPGSRVESGEPLIEVTTEKATFEIPAPAAGIVHAVAQEGATLEVQDVMGYILAEGEAPPAASDRRPVSAAPSEKPAGARSSPSSASPPAAVEQRAGGSVSVRAGVRSSPAARRLSSEHGIDITRLRGSGPGGRIVEVDVNAEIARLEESGRPSNREQSG
jgi:pyruvate dehydrogenase E2 component (dihydrolipoamide acetyltransferase)